MNKKKIIGIQLIKSQNYDPYHILYLTYPFDASDSGSGIKCEAARIYRSSMIDGLKVGDEVILSYNVSSKGNRYVDGVLKV